MRRIIERVVTIVTTTTWKISWEPDSSQANPSSTPEAPLSTASAAELVSRLRGPELSERTSPRPMTVETKEADLSEIKDIDESVSE